MSSIPVCARVVLSPSGLRQSSLKHYRPSALDQSMRCTLERLQLLCDTFTARRGANAWRIPSNAVGRLLCRFSVVSLAPTRLVVWRRSLCQRQRLSLRQLHVEDHCGRCPRASGARQTCAALIGLLKPLPVQAIQKWRGYPSP